MLTGTRDDGSAGLAVIKASGGAMIVQDPKEAMYAGMPASAIANVAVDAIVPSELVASTIAPSGTSRRVSSSLGPAGALGPWRPSMYLITLPPRGNKASMTDEQLVREAKAREQRARQREARALEHEREATRKAKEATSESSAASYRREAETHRAAADIHRKAVEVQAEHAREHAS